MGLPAALYACGPARQRNRHSHMPTPIAPTKTALGQDELRHRTRGLSQRHRTVLLLVDGRRALSEVLSQAQQAGAAISHFEELVRLGLVALPIEVAVADPIDTVTAALDSPELTTLELTVPTVELPTEPGMLADAPEEPSTEAPPAAAAERPADTPLSPMPSSTPAPVIAASIPPSVEPPPEQPLLQQVRALLIDTLRIDTPLFSARILMRVNSAQTTSEMIDLVWDIEHHLNQGRHSRSGLISLQRARELLGLGNTLVDDTRPDIPSEW